MASKGQRSVLEVPTGKNYLPSEEPRDAESAGRGKIVDEADPQTMLRDPRERYARPRSEDGKKIFNQHHSRRQDHRVKRTSSADPTLPAIQG